MARVQVWMAFLLSWAQARADRGLRGRSGGCPAAELGSCCAAEECGVAVCGLLQVVKGLEAVRCAHRERLGVQA